MGSEPPLFDGRNFSYWKSRMGAYLDALSPDVWNATKIGYTGALTPEQQKWNAKARNQRSVSWLSLKTKVVEGFPVWASKPAATGLVISASKSL
jgi:hypothetical protein